MDMKRKRNTDAWTNVFRLIRKTAEACEKLRTRNVLLVHALKEIENKCKDELPTLQTTQEILKIIKDLKL